MRNAIVKILMLAALSAGATMSVRAGEVGAGFPIGKANANQYGFDYSPAANRSQPPQTVPLHVPAAAPAAERLEVNPPSTTAVFENQPLNLGNQRRSDRASGAGEARSLPSVFSVLFYVTVICGIFIFVLYMMKKYLPGHRQLFTHPSMEVLGRTHLDQKRYVSLLRVGKRIIVVGVSPDDMRPLSEITDEEEITGIMEVARPKTEMGLSIFQKFFKRQVIETDSAERRAYADARAKEIEEQTATLRERVAAVRKTEDKPHRVDAVG